MSLLTIEEPHGPGQGKSTLMDHPLFRLGFRPFYLMATAFAAISVPLWIARYFGLAQRLSHVNVNWHMHEMVFGFAIAVIIGFLFTAGRNWTGLWTPRRGHLAALAGLWLAGRIAMLCFPPLPAALVDVLFLPFAAWPMYRVLQRAGSKRNMFLIGLLGLLTSANILFHASTIGWLSISTFTPMHAAVLIIVMIESVMGGRVIPGFTANAVQGLKPVTDAKRDRISVALTALASIAWVVQVPGPFLAALTFAASCAQMLRVAGWKPQYTLSKPLVWILHASYGWIPVGFFLLSLSALHLTSSSAAFHALGIGSMAGLIIGMITRTALGHTGRPLKAGRSELLMYLLIQVGVIARLLAVTDVMGWRNPLLVVAAVSWTSVFLLYVVVYGPYLMRARIDGRDG